MPYPEAFVAANRSEQGHLLTELPDDAVSAWKSIYDETLKTNDAGIAGRTAWANVYRRWFKSPSGWAPLKAFENVEFKAIFKSDRIIYGTASLQMVDKDKQMITADALKAAFRSYLDRGQVLFYHKNIPIGTVVPSYKAPDGRAFESGVRENALNVVVRVYKDTKIANEVWQDVEDGRLRSFSIGGEVIGDTVMVTDGDRTYERVDRLDLHEISIVPDPANDASYFTIIKSSIKSTEQKVETVCEETKKELEVLKAKIAELEKNAAMLTKPKDCKGREPGDAAYGDGCAEAKAECPPGEHLDDAGDCVPMDEKSATQPETKAPQPDPVKVATEADVFMKASKEEVAAIFAAEAKKIVDAVTPKPPEKSAEKPPETPPTPPAPDPVPTQAPAPAPVAPPTPPPEPREKTTVVLEETKGTEAPKTDWTRPPWTRDMKGLGSPENLGK